MGVDIGQGDFNIFKLGHFQNVLAQLFCEPDRACADDCDLKRHVILLGRLRADRLMFGKV